MSVCSKNCLLWYMYQLNVLVYSAQMKHLSEAKNNKNVVLSNLVCTTRFWNNRHQVHVHSKSKDLKDK